MRILQAHNRHATRGGADIVMQQERELLTDAGHAVDELVTDAKEAGGWREGLDAVYNRDTVRRLEDVAARFRPDVLHVHTPFPLMSPSVFRAAAALGLPTVGTLHSFRYSCVAGTLLRDGALCHECVGRRVKLPAVQHRCYHDSLGASGALAASLTLHHGLGTFRRHVGRFLAMTDFAKGLIVQEGVPADRVVVKPNMAADPGPQPDVLDRPRQVLFAGRLVEEKGVRTLLEAWSALRADGHVLRVCGEGPLRGLVEQAQTADPSIQLLGWVTAAEMAAEIRDARVALVPSEWYEAGPPLVLLDALAHGTPVVASDLENISATLVSTGAGATFRTGSAASLAEVLGRVLGDREVLQTYQRTGRQLYLDSHTPERALATLEQVYEAVTSEPPVGRRRRSR